MGLPGDISLSSGRSWYRSAGLGAGTGLTFNRIRVSGAGPVESARHDSARTAIAVPPRSVRYMGSLLASRIEQVHTPEPGEKTPRSIEDKCKAVVCQLPAAVSSLPEDHLVMDVEVGVLFLA